MRRAVTSPILRDPGTALTSSRGSRRRSRARSNCWQDSDMAYIVFIHLKRHSKKREGEKKGKKIQFLCLVLYLLLRLLLLLHPWSWRWGLCLQLLGRFWEKDEINNIIVFSQIREKKSKTNWADINRYNIFEEKQKKINHGPFMVVWVRDVTNQSMYEWKTCFDNEIFCFWSRQQMLANDPFISALAKVFFWSMADRRSP